jgi:hypothetical protein
MMCFPFEQIPRVVQDAVVITRQLGIRYLWVDAFCILQDSTEDWNCESACMAGIYRNSYATIAASGAKTPGESLYLERLDIVNRPVRIDLGEAYAGSTARWVHGGRRPLTASMKDDPLQQRRWTLQETQLSIRVLYFGKHEFFWQCREGLTRELAPAQFVIAADPLVPRRMFDAFPTWPTNIFSRWCDLVEQYTTRQLTYKSDMLPAMSGLAAELALFLQSRHGRRPATLEESRRLRPQRPALPELPIEQEVVPSGIPLMFPGFRGKPVHDGGNASILPIVDQMELIQGRPILGYEHRPLRTDRPVPCLTYLRLTPGRLRIWTSI